MLWWCLGGGGVTCAYMQAGMHVYVMLSYDEWGESVRFAMASQQVTSAAASLRNVTLNPVSQLRSSSSWTTHRYWFTHIYYIIADICLRIETPQHVSLSDEQSKHCNLIHLIL